MKVFHGKHLDLVCFQVLRTLAQFRMMNTAKRSIVNRSWLQSMSAQNTLLALPLAGLLDWQDQFHIERATMGIEQVPLSDSLSPQENLGMNTEMVFGLFFP
jgi:hypothetical protein